MTHTSPINVVGRLERLPMTGYQRRLFAVIASAWLVDQIDVALLTFLLGSLVREFHMSPVQVGLLASMTFAGQLVGNLAAGTASDLYGRRRVFQVTMVMWGLASLAAALSWSVGALMVFRFLIGVGVGGEAPVAQALVSELLPAGVRGRYIAIMEGFWAVGFVLSGTISYLLLPHLGWRWVFVAVGALAGLVFLVRRSIPESPRWLEGEGRLAEADAILTRMEDQVMRQSGLPLPPPEIVAADASRRSPWRTLLDAPYVVRSAMAGSLWFFALLGYFGLSSWLALLLEAKGFSIVKSVGFVTLITIGGIPGFATAAWSLERIGRKPTTIFFLVASAAAAYAYGSMQALTPLFVSGFVMQFFMFGMWSCLYAYTPELYPTRARATGAGFASACGRVGAMAGPIVVGFVVKDIGQLAVFSLGAGSFIIAAAFVLVLGIETRGRTLEAISA
jgi:putative MFS transporter